MPKINPPSRPDYFYRQSAVIPFCPGKNRLKLLMICNRKRNRWIFPKGIIEPSLGPDESALQEAYEEAGIRGKIVSEVLGEFRYHKWGGTCTVRVFLMEIDEILTSWPEVEYRYRIWVGVEEAIQFLKEKKLKRIVKEIPVFFKKHRKSESREKGEDIRAGGELRC